jgi:hypothetical protein
MTTYQDIDNKLDEINLILIQNRMSEYTNICEINGIYYKRSIIKLKRKPKEE